MRALYLPFLARPFSGSLFGLIALFIVWQIWAFVRQARKGRVQKEGPLELQHE